MYGPNDYRAYVNGDYNSIYHFGILGMKWGVRRYQNEDGTLTPEGKRRYTTKDDYTGVDRLNARGHWATLLSKHKKLKSTLLNIDERYHKAYRNLADKEDKERDDTLKKIGYANVKGKDKFTYGDHLISKIKDELYGYADNCVNHGNKVDPKILRRKAKQLAKTYGISNNTRIRTTTKVWDMKSKPKEPVVTMDSILNDLNKDYEDYLRFKQIHPAK